MLAAGLIMMGVGLLLVLVGMGGRISDALWVRRVNRLHKQIMEEENGNSK